MSRILLVVIYISRSICCMVLVNRRRRSVGCLVVTCHRIIWRRSCGRLQYRLSRIVHIKDGRGSLGRKRILWNITLAVMARTWVSCWSLLLILFLGTKRISAATIFRKMMFIYMMHLLIIGRIRWMSVLRSSSWCNLSGYRWAKRHVRLTIHLAINLLRTCKRNEDHAEHF